MTTNYGPGVSRVLEPSQTGYKTVLWQTNKPPCDAELTLIGDLASEANRILTLRGTPSGWYGDAINPQDSYVTNKNWSNWFQFGPQFSGEKQSIQWAVVNGWVVPVTGTLTGNPPGSPNNADLWNRITLPPPPSNTGDARVDFAFLEVWLARIPPNPATTNKPSSSAIWRYGNVEGGFSFIADDLQDPEIGFETTQRVQLQYRIRVVSGLVGLASYPDGFDPSVVKGQGAALAPTSYIYENMRKELGDPGLWRAGDGASNTLGTVDGYVYAIPLCAVFRRNSVSWDGAPGQNLNGAFNRNPLAVDRTGYRTYTTVPTITGNITSSALTLTLSTVTGVQLPLTPASPVAIQIGDEILYYSAITGTTMTISARGSLGSLAESHKAGASVVLLSGRPDGLFSDQITKNDILDLRHAVNPGGFDYQALLKGNLDRLLRGKLRSTWKRSGGGPQGPVVMYQDVVGNTSTPLGITKLDGVDKIRQVYGDPALLQPVVIPVGPPASTGTSVLIGGTLGGVSYGISGGVSINHPAGTGFLANDVITIPKSLFLGSLPGSDADQLVLVGDENFVKIRFVGTTANPAVGPLADLSGTYYNVANVGGDLQITFDPSFPGANVSAFITIYLQYGAGRGLSHRPDAVHSVAYISSNALETVIRPVGIPTDNQALSTSWAALWSKFQGSMFNGQLPQTAEAFVDPGSKTVIIAPFKQLNLAFPSSNTLKSVQLPTQAMIGGDPLGLFSGDSDPTGTRKNMVVVIPRRMMPSWGAVHAPILPQALGQVSQGINFGFNLPEGLIGAQSNYVSTTNGSVTYGVFATSIGYNAAGTIAGIPVAGMQQYTDTRGLGRTGLQLSPFYMCARLFAVYELADYTANGSSFDATTRAEDTGGAVNLLRQNYQGPTFWIEQDANLDPSYILNSEVIDLSKSPNAIANFAAGSYVIEASIFAVDRGSFDLSQDCKVVLTRNRPEGLTANANLTAFPTFVLPGAPEPGDQIAITYSREPYSGDAWGSQMVQSDSNYAVGALTTATRYQLMNTDLTYSSLARSNQKVLEVLAGISFQTTLGTGRLGGSVPSSLDVRSVGFEPWTIPSTPVDARPVITPTALVSVERDLTVGTNYNGAVERLPLGALFRSKDFRGNAVGGPTGDLRQLVFGSWYSPATVASNVMMGNSDYQEVSVRNPDMASGNSGEIVVHVDGNNGNYGVLTAYRTTRGGSVFSESGGDVAAVLPGSTPATTFGGVLSGVAMLVRNTPTSIGANEVSAGQELMMLIVTTGRPQGSSGVSINTVQCGTAGTAEGYSAADLYRIAGHPLTTDSARPVLDPSTVVLARESDILF